GQMDLFSGNKSVVQDEDLEVESSGIKEFDSLATVVTDYYIIDTPEKRALLNASLQKQKEFCFDTETTGLDAINASMVGISFSWKEREGYYVPVFADDFEKTRQILLEFSNVLYSDHIMKIG